MKYSEIIAERSMHEQVENVELAGRLNVVSGQIVVTDPLSNPDREPLARTIKKGEYPVYLYTDTEYSAIGLAELRISGKAPVKWELAVTISEADKTLQEGYILGYAVDSGFGCFMDVKAGQAMLQNERELADDLGDNFTSYFEDVISPLMFDEEFPLDFVNHFPYEGENENIIMFRSGHGDGYYASYWGFDANGDVCSLVTTFDVFEGEG